MNGDQPRLTSSGWADRGRHRSRSNACTGIGRARCRRPGGGMMTPRLEAGAVSVWPGFRLVVGSAGIGGLGLADEIHREGPTRAAVPHLSGTIRNRKHHQQSSPRRVPLVPNPSAHNIRRSLAQRSPHLPPIDAVACDRKSISRIDRSCSPLQAGNPETPTNYLSQVINSRIDIHLVRSQEIQKANAPVSTGLTKAQQH